MIGELYSRLLDEEAIPAIAEVVEDLSEFRFQDDQDSNHGTKVAMDLIYDRFEERIESDNRDTKFADIWPVENILGFLKEKTREQTFANFDSLVNFINSEEHKITPEQ